MKKTLSIILITTLTLSLLTIFSFPPASATFMTKLHTNQNLIYDANNNQINLRGVGLAGFTPNLMLWEKHQTDDWKHQWNYNPDAAMTSTFSSLKNDWNVNMIRIFIYPSWWYRGDIIPAQVSSDHSSKTTPINIKSYVSNLCSKAQEYGIYVNIVPYTLTPHASSYDLDPYADIGESHYQGLPLCNIWSNRAQNFLDSTEFESESAFWSWFWSDMASTLKNHPNVIYEAWNEPNDSPLDNSPISTKYLQYLELMYNSIRNVDKDAPMMFQWRLGHVPNGWNSDLRWVKTIDDKFSPTNIIYTTHFYYQAGWGAGTDNSMSTHKDWGWALDEPTLKSQIQIAIDSMGIVAPLVINEEGSCLSGVKALGNNVTESYIWFENLIKAQNSLNVGSCAYYWLSDAGLGTAFAGETILSNNHSPNEMGTAYINAYTNPPSQTLPNDDIPLATQTPFLPVPKVDLDFNTEMMIYLIIALLSASIVWNIIIKKKKRRKH